MLISRSATRQVLLSVLGALVFVFLYEATTLDSRNVSPVTPDGADVRAARASQLRFTATAYCKGTTTASGVNVRTGVAAADPQVLPVGSVVQVSRLGERYDGIYTIMDTGPRVQGRHIDIYMWSCTEALALGRRDAVLSIVRLGWNPRTSATHLLERLFGPRRPALPGSQPEPAPAQVEVLR